jgi:hypothetical protein
MLKALFLLNSANTLNNLDVRVSRPLEAVPTLVVDSIDYEIYQPKYDELTIIR